MILGLVSGLLCSFPLCFRASLGFRSVMGDTSIEQEFKGGGS